MSLVSLASTDAGGLETETNTILVMLIEPLGSFHIGLTNWSLMMLGSYENELEVCIEYGFP